MMGMSNRDKTLNNLLTFTDFLGQPIGAGVAVGVAKGLVKGVGSEVYRRNVVKTALQASFREPASRASMMEAGGNVGKAAAEDAAEQIVSRVKGENTLGNILRNLPGAFNGTIDRLRNNPGRLRREAVERIIQDEQKTADEVIRGAINVMKVDRVPVIAAVRQKVQELLEKERIKYPELDNTLLNNAIRYDSDLNRHWTDWYLGPNGDSLFGSEKRAQAWIKSTGLQGAETEQQGTGWAVRVSHPLDETGYVRDILLATDEVKSPKTWLNALSNGLIGKLRTPEETLSEAQRAARKVATYSPSVYEQIARNTLEPIRKMRSWSSIPYTDRKRKWQEFKKVIEASEQEYNPVTKQNGIRYETPNEVDAAYQKSIGRLPDEQETVAYFSWKRGEELWETWRDMQFNKNLHRLGAENVTMKVGLEETPRSITGIKEVKFDGMRLKGMPGGNDTVLVVGKTFADSFVTTLNKLRPSKDGIALSEDILQGKSKAYQVANHFEQPLKDFNRDTKDSLVRFVISRGETGPQEGPLEWKKLGRRPVNYDYDHHVKQPIVKYDPVSGIHSYLGDKTISVHNIRALSKDVADKLNNIRLLLKENKIAEAKTFHENSGLPQEWSEVQGWFKPTIFRGEGGRFEKTPSKLSLDEPIHSVPRGKALISTPEYSNDVASRFKGREFRDVAHEGSARYLGEKYDTADVFSLGNEGTAANPLYRQKPVEYLNPITSLNRALVRIANASFMDDYKAFSVEHWIQEAKGYLNARPEEIMASPYWYFHNPVWKSGTPTDDVIVNNLKVANAQIRQFIGEVDPNKAWLHSGAQKLSDSLYTSGRGRIALATERMLPKIRDPLQFLRSMTFHYKLGFFNIPQLWVQSQTFATIWGVAGAKYAGPGTAASMMYGWAKLNRHPEIWEKLDETLSKAGWKPGQFMEATKGGEGSGFLNVVNEKMAFRDDPNRLNIISDGKQSFLNAGTWFFRTGEKSVRLGAWYTAYKEYRDTVNTVGALGRRDWQKILNRADDLYSNMSRASNSSIQKGVMSIPTQFLSYQMRTAELFLGKRLTVPEKMRLFGYYSALYGIPGAFGLSGFPIGDYLRKSAIADGYNVGDNYITTAVMEGLPSIILGMTTGNYYNVEGRYGLQGFDPLRSALRSDKTMWDILTGATGQTFANSIMATHGFWKAMGSLIQRNGEFPMKFEDFLEPFKEISSINNTWKLIFAMNYGKLITKKEGVVGDVSKGNAIFQYISGLQPQDVDDNYVKREYQKSEEQFQKYTLDKFIRDYRRGLVAARDNNPEQAKEFFRRARTWLDSSGYPEHQKSTAYTIAVKGYDSLIEQGKYNWAYGKTVPETRKKTAEEQRRKELIQKYQDIK